jgi:hypothetical protein
MKLGYFMAAMAAAIGSMFHLKSKDAPAAVSSPIPVFHHGSSVDYGSGPNYAQVYWARRKFHRGKTYRRFRGSKMLERHSRAR